MKVAKYESYGVQMLLNTRVAECKRFCLISTIFFSRKTLFGGIKD